MTTSFEANPLASFHHTGEAALGVPDPVTCHPFRLVSLPRVRRTPDWLAMLTSIH